MKSNLHKKLQQKAIAYLANKQYWVRAQEWPTPAGIIDAYGISNIRNFDTAAIEVKVSKNDYKSRSQKDKEYNAEHLNGLANYCYILCPDFLMGMWYESPKWGVLWYSEKTGRLRLMREPTRFDMSDHNKLAVIISLFSSGINNPEKLLQSGIVDEESHA
jgi:hypothetical protein